MPKLVRTLITEKNSKQRKIPMTRKDKILSLNLIAQLIFILAYLNHDMRYRDLTNVLSDIYGLLAFLVLVSAFILTGLLREGDPVSLHLSSSLSFIAFYIFIVSLSSISDEALIILMMFVSGYIILGTLPLVLNISKEKLKKIIIGYLALVGISIIFGNLIVGILTHIRNLIFIIVNLLPISLLIIAKFKKHKIHKTSQNHLLALSVGSLVIVLQFLSLTYLNANYYTYFYIHIILACLTLSFFIHRLYKAIDYEINFLDFLGKKSLLCLTSLIIYLFLSFTITRSFPNTVLSLMFVIFVLEIYFILWKNNIIKNLDDNKNLRIQLILQDLDKTREEENRLHDFLHNEVQQNIMYASMVLGSGKEISNEEALRLRDILDESVDQIRDLGYKDNRPIKEKILDKIRRKMVLSESKILIEYFENLEKPLPPPYDYLVFSFISEIINNIYKHGTGHSAEIHLDYKKDMIKIYSTNSSDEKESKKSSSSNTGLARMKLLSYSLEGKFETKLDARKKTFETHIALPVIWSTTYKYYLLEEGDEND